MSLIKSVFLGSPGQYSCFGVDVKFKNSKESKLTPSSNSKILTSTNNICEHIF